MTTGSDSTNLISRELIYCLFYGWRSDLVIKVCSFYPNVCITLWVRLHPQAHGKSELCWSTLKLQLNAFKCKTSFKWTSTVLLIQFRRVFVRARPCKDHHRSGSSSSFTLGMATGEHLYLSGLDTNLSAKLCFFRKLTHTLFIFCVLKNGTETQNRDAK